MKKKIKVTDRMRFEIKLELIKNKRIDGRLVVAILDSVLKQATKIKKKLDKELKKKKPDRKVLHDLSVESRAFRNLVDEMIVNLVKVITKINLQKRRKKKIKQHAKVGRK